MSLRSRPGVSTVRERGTKREEKGVGVLTPTNLNVRLNLDGTVSDCGRRELSRRSRVVVGGGGGILPIFFPDIFTGDLTRLVILKDYYLYKTQT